MKTLRQAIEAQRRGSELTKRLLPQEAASTAVSTLAASDPIVQAPSRQEAPAVSSHVASAPALAADASSTLTALAPSPALRPTDELAASGSTQSSHAGAARHRPAAPGDSHELCQRWSRRLEVLRRCRSCPQQPAIFTQAALRLERAICSVRFHDGTRHALGRRPAWIFSCQQRASSCIVGRPRARSFSSRHRPTATASRSGDAAGCSHCGIAQGKAFG